jgi:hypothetical protein
MANLDDVVRSAVPGGNIAKPLMIALLAYLPQAPCSRVAGRRVRRRSRSRLPPTKDPVVCSQD